MTGGPADEPKGESDDTHTPVPNRPVWGTSAADVWVSDAADRPAWAQQTSSSWVPDADREPIIIDRSPRSPRAASNVLVSMLAALALVAGVAVISSVGNGSSVSVGVAPQLETGVDGRTDGDADGASRREAAPRDEAPGGAGDASVAAAELQAEASPPGALSPLVTASTVDDAATSAEGPDTAQTPEVRTPSVDPSGESASPPPANRRDAPESSADTAVRSGSTSPPLSGGASAPAAPATVDEPIHRGAINQAAAEARQDTSALRSLTVPQLTTMAVQACSGESLAEAVADGSRASGVAADAIRLWLQAGTSILCPGALS